MNDYLVRLKRELVSEELLKYLSTLGILYEVRDKKIVKVSSSPIVSSLHNVDDDISINIPTLEDVKVYATERNSTVDPTRFFGYYNNLGWKTKTGMPINDWKTQFQSWETNSCNDRTKMVYTQTQLKTVAFAEQPKTIDSNIKNLESMLEAI